MSNIDDLVQTLLAETRSGAIRWERADARARSFIARRSSGTVLITGPGGPVAAVPFTPQDAVKAAVTLSVKNAQGSTVEEVEWAPAPTLVPTLAFQPLAVKVLPELYSVVKEQVTQAGVTIRSLTDEFKQREE